MRIQKRAVAQYITGCMKHWGPTLGIMALPDKFMLCIEQPAVQTMEVLFSGI